MHFEVFIPATLASPQQHTLRVEAESWLLALRDGLTRAGRPPQTRIVACTVLPDHTVLASDEASRCVFRLRPLDPARPQPAPQPAPPAAAEPDDGNAPTMVLGAISRDASANNLVAVAPSSVESASSLPPASLPPASLPPRPTVGPTISAPGGLPPRQLPTYDDAPPPVIGATLASPAAAVAAVAASLPLKAASPAPATATARSEIMETAPALPAISPTPAPPQAPAAAAPAPAAAAPAPAAAAPAPAPATPVPAVQPPAQAAPTAAPAPQPKPAPRAQAPSPDPWPAPEALTPSRARVAPTAIAKAHGDEPDAEPPNLPLSTKNAPKTVVMEAVDMDTLRRKADEAKRADPERFKSTMVISSEEARAQRPITAEIPAPTPVPGESNEILEDIFLDIYDLFEPGMTQEGAVDFILNLATTHIQAQAGLVIFATPDGNSLAVAGGRGARADLTALFAPIHQGIAGFCTREGASLNLTAPQDDPRTAEDLASRLNLGAIVSLLCAPIQHQGRVYGCLELINRRGRPGFSDVERAALTYIGQQYGAFVHQQLA